MLQDITLSLAAMNDHHRVTQAHLDALTNNQAPTGQNLPPPPINQNSPSPVVLANNQTPLHVAYPQDPLIAWLHPDNNPPREFNNPMYAPDPPHDKYEAYSMGQYAESIVNLARENKTITMLKE